jgi:hypothetical protein
MGRPVPGLNVRLGDGREWALSVGINRSESLQLHCVRTFEDGCNGDGGA